MGKILDFIANETGGKSYKSQRFCYDEEIKLPSLRYDDSQDFTVRKGKNGETDTSLKTYKNLTETAKKFQREKPLFKYFLDGSRRVYKVDDIEYSRRLFPVVGGQIGVACCYRNAPDKFGKAIFENHLVLSLPSFARIGQHPTQFLGRLTKQINENQRFKRLSVEFDEILTYSSDKTDIDREEYLNRGIATIQDRMIEYEKQVVAELVKKNLLDQDNYLIKDGSLQYSKTTAGNFRELAVYQSNYRRVVGVSKSFNPEFSTDKRGMSNAAKIADLPAKHRTPAIMYVPSDNNTRIGRSRFSIWYVRIREAKYTESPFAGVVKLEKVLITEEELENGLDSGEVDRITANIINERNPVCYGKDGRWANHLYPIYLTENFIKSKFLSDLHFINLF